MEIRAFRASDHAAVVALWTAVFPDDPPGNAPAEMIRRKAGVQPELFLVAELTGVVVGTVLGGFDGVRGWIYHLAVAPSERRRGVGARLVEEVERRLGALGCPKVNLQVRATNAEVVAFYRSAGYHVEERVSMGKRLATAEPVTLAQETPRQPEVVALITALDAYCSALYPAESNHFVDIEALCAPAVRFFVARIAGEAVGCGAMRIEDGYAEVKRMYVLPRVRGRSIGVALLARIEEQARAEGITCLRLETGIHQPEALGLYRRLGFVGRGPFGAYAPDPLSVFMEKTLG